MYFNFIWQNKPDKIKQEVLVQDYEVGGIKIIDIVNFTTALKVTWIRRCFQTHSRWITLFESVTDLTTKQLVIFYSKKETKY